MTDILKKNVNFNAVTNFGIIISHTHMLCFPPQVVCEEGCLDCASGQEGNNRSTVLRGPLGCLRAGLHGGVWLCGARCPGPWLPVPDPLCPRCLLLPGPRRTSHYPSVIGAWAPADQRYPDDGRALVIFHSLMLASSSQLV